jgi:uncharacterized protein YajQ (UPF0234 family)
MAKEHSLDITAEFDKQEMKNAIDQAKREVANRYDFKGLTAEIEYSEKAKSITLISSSDNKVEAMMDIVISKVIKRGISSKAVNEHSRESVGGGNVKLVLSIRDVITSEDAKKIVKEIKAKKLKVNAQIQGEEIRVKSKSIDELQATMRVVKEMDLDLPISFTNMK